ncbi:MULTISPECIES: hypothetical protein [Methylobacterium]|uniref:Uncharacterized protein n=1 Tax=Methylobacterium longum TaxID=767694 RepID=A0ABT8AN79_9HYPH|nr:MULTISPECIES: hypothetical protein [Methylobacterium]MDN3570931.1 hypothetical protein [Methylobacterium longum]GJE12039.1 hypothetical protein FOHLNKBM_3085 [Methylobacterium longum]
MQDGRIGPQHDNPSAAAAPWRAGRAVESGGRTRADAWVLGVDGKTPAETGPPPGWAGGPDRRAAGLASGSPTRAQAMAHAGCPDFSGSSGAEPAARSGPVSWRVRRSHQSAAARPVPARPVPARPEPPAPSPAPRIASPAPAAMPDLERALVNPAAVFATPAALLDHPRLLRPLKREILRRWAWDEYLKDVAAAEGMTAGEPSRLDAVKVALLALGETWGPHPAAPAVSPIAPAAGDTLPAAA